jgi:heptaprenyl diphosphate synthase
MRQTTRDDHRIAWLTALAITIHIAESALPSPIPGIKPGLANTISVAALIRLGWHIAAWITFLRVIAGSLLLGTFLSPTFVLSAGGALAGILSLALTAAMPGQGCSAVGHSVSAALSHTAAQFWLAYWLFIPLPGLLSLFPVLMTAALFFGVLTGIAAGMLAAKPGLKSDNF